MKSFLSILKFLNVWFKANAFWDVYYISLYIYSIFFFLLYNWFTNVISDELLQCTRVKNEKI